MLPVLISTLIINEYFQATTLKGTHIINIDELQSYHG